MSDIFMRIMNIVDRIRTMEVSSTVEVGAFGAIVVLGILSCILGYRLLRFWMMIGGFLVGAGLAFSIVHGLGTANGSSYLVPMLITGIVLAVIAFFIYKAGIFILGAGIGWALSIYIIHPTSSSSFFLCLLIGAGLGSLAVRYCREVIVVATSLIGGVMAGVSLAKIGGLAEFPYGIGMSVGIAALGILLQFAINKPAYEEEKIGETEEAREKDLEDTVLGERDTFEEYKVEYEEDQEEKKRADVVRQRLREKKTQD